MTKTFCDLCGAEAKPWPPYEHPNKDDMPLVLSVESKFSEGTCSVESDLCWKCQQDIIRAYLKELERRELERIPPMKGKV